MTNNDCFDTIRQKITTIENEKALAGPYGDYFKRTAYFLKAVLSQYDFILSGEIYDADITELAKRNEALFADILPENYGTSYANPAFSVKCFGSDFGKVLTFLAAEFRSLIMYAHEKRLDLMLIRLRLFTEIYDAFFGTEACSPDYQDIMAIIKNYFFENLEAATIERLTNQISPQNDFAARIIMDSDLTDLRYLYHFGEYVTENEFAVARHLNSLPDDKIKLMADTFTEGYRIGFKINGKDIKKKKVTAIHYRLGFERMIRKAVENFAEMGLEPAFFRTSLTILEGRSAYRLGFLGAYANKQYEFDHKDDSALVLDQDLSDRRLLALEKAYRTIEAEAKVYAGPARMETFGEPAFSLAYKDEALSFSDSQQKLVSQYVNAAGEISNRYLPSEEISYTIIAFPAPEIGPRFNEIFDETIALNTLDYNLYRDVQQIIIDALDQAEFVKITGRGANKTNLLIAMNELIDPASQTNFENCVADVNIPVGEVFTSPKLKGSTGILHVTSVFLNEVEFKDLTLNLNDGMVTDYRCANFPKEEENRKFIKENILFHHDSLPVSEFAIGTNTTAYMVGKKYGIADRFPILIAEKTGPHFAFGDTCYAKAEDVAVFNPDGKEIVARDNEISLNRKADKSKAYFNCHTDITIPYDELGAIIALTKSGAELPIFSGGKFVLPGCEELNKAFDCL
ncbi:MAG: aminopeptidase [Lachnospiraceae bacterium]|nr:aminopeptidase [Lachnospiraceae bacterium]